MATYQRKLGTQEVYDVSGQAPRYINYDEAQKNNIWSQVQDVPTLDNRSPRTLDSLGGGEALTFDRGTQPDSYGIFNNALMEMLKKYQSLGTKPMQQQALDLSTQQAERGMAEATPGMSPTQQNLIRSSSMQALNPSIQGAEDTSRTFSEQLGGFSSVLDQVKSFGESMQKIEQQKKSEAIGLVDKILREGTSSDLEALLRSNPELLKMAGYKADLFSSLIDSRKKSESAMQQQEQMKTQQEKQLYDLSVALKKKELNKPYYAPKTSTPPSQKIVTINGKSYIQNPDGSYSEPNILGGGNVTPEKVETAQKALALAEKLGAEAPGFAGAVGFKGLIGSVTGAIPGTPEADFTTDYNSLKSLLTLENMGLMKGVLSDSDIKILQQAATALDTKMSEAKFISTLNEVKNTLRNAVSGSGQVKEETVIVSKDGQDYTLPKSELQDALNQGYTQK